MGWSIPKLLAQCEIAIWRRARFEVVCSRSLWVQVYPFRAYSSVSLSGAMAYRAICVCLALLSSCQLVSGNALREQGKTSSKGFGFEHPDEISRCMQLCQNRVQRFQDNCWKLQFQLKHATADDRNDFKEALHQCEEMSDEKNIVKVSGECSTKCRRQSGER